MRRILGLSLIIVIAFASSFSLAQEKVSPGSKVIGNLKYPDLKWKVPEVGKEVTRTVLKNGLILYMMEDHELPIVTAHALIRTGSVYDSKEDMAVGGITGTVMRTGGTRSFTPDSLNELLEYIAGSVESGIGAESGSASMSVMSKDLDVGLKVLFEVLRYPVFDTSKINLEKSHVRESIRRRNDWPGAIVGREFAHLIYGDHPYGRILEWGDVKDIDRSKLVAYHDRYYHPNNVMIAFAGDFDTKKLAGKIEKLFGDWPKTEIKFPSIPEVVHKPKPGVYVINKDITQANIDVGQLGIKRDNPDKYAIALMNYVLGGGSFTSRLTSRVRSDEGLAYSVGSRFSTDSRDYGTFLAYTQTKTASAHRVLEIFKSEFDRIRSELVTSAEFETARDSYINNYVFQFDSPDEVVNRLMSLEYDGYPSDYYQKYLDNIRAVTIEDLKRVASQYLKPEEMTIVVVADTAKVVGNLGDFGAVTNIPLEEPKVE